jgi:hypothetical protein
MTRRQLAAALALAAAPLAAAGEGRAGAVFAPARPFALRPLAARPDGFTPLPSSGPALILLAPGVRADQPPFLTRDPGRPLEAPRWNPSRTEPVVGFDATGRLATIQEHAPGFFSDR